MSNHQVLSILFPKSAFSLFLFYIPNATVFIQASFASSIKMSLIGLLTFLVPSSPIQPSHSCDCNYQIAQTDHVILLIEILLTLTYGPAVFFPNCGLNCGINLNGSQPVFLQQNSTETMYVSYIVKIPFCETFPTFTHTCTFWIMI